MSRIMHDGTQWQVLWQISIYPHFYTPHTDRGFFICPSTRLCTRRPFFPFLSLNQKKRHCLSLPLVFCVHANTHVHKYSMCTDTQRPAPTERGARTLSLPSAAVMAPSCQNILAFSPSLSPKQPDWACLCRFTETAVYPPSLCFFLSYPSCSLPLCILATSFWFSIACIYIFKKTLFIH